MREEEDEHTPLPEPGSLAPVGTWGPVGASRAGSSVGEMDDDFFLNELLMSQDSEVRGQTSEAASSSRGPVPPEGG